MTIWLLGSMIPGVVGLTLAEPLLEDDYFRYMWDGRVFTNGINPYLYGPSDSALDHLDVDYRNKIGYKDVSTIYPPFTQFVFAITYLAFPDSLIGFKFVFVLFDIATGFLLLVWLAQIGARTQWCLLYFLNPLILKEIANSGHFDAIPVFLVFFATFLFVTKNTNRPQGKK